jgi:cation diffusion facilitator CzcD-associated flavoprotein CzcO
MADRPDVLVVGAGFAGMYAVHRFRSQGLAVKALEAGTDVGGTWYWNRYPGARCDVPSLEYSYGFSAELEQEWDWPEVFSAQEDILRYANHVAAKFDLRRDIQFDTRVVAVEWRDDAQRWRLTTQAGEQFEAPFCVMATGCLSVPIKPTVPGAAYFRGEVYHTGTWPKERVDLTGKRVGIIGTGSSGVQAIPELARQAAHLTVFQRTPVYTVPANRKRMRAEVQDEFREHYREIRQLQQRNQGGVSNFRPRKSARRVDNVDTSAVAPPNRLLDLTVEQRRDAIERFGLGALLAFRDVYGDARANEIANELYRETVRTMVRDPATAERLLPKTYGLGCKRQVIDRDYYDTFNRTNVTLVDLVETPLETIDATGIRTSERHHELDVLIYATGFDAMTGALLRANIRGRGGRALADQWRDGPIAYLGLQMSGFPNLFTVTGPGSPSVLCNMLVAIEQHVNWIGDCMAYLRANGVRTIEPRPESEQAWVAHVNEVAAGTMFTAPTCNSWYLGANVPGKARIFMPYVGGYPRYRARCEHEAAHCYEGFALG